MAERGRREREEKTNGGALAERRERTNVCGEPSSSGVLWSGWVRLRVLRMRIFAPWQAA
jgi:hypothetical protein